MGEFGTVIEGDGTHLVYFLETENTETDFVINPDVTSFGECPPPGFGENCGVQNNDVQNDVIDKNSINTNTENQTPTQPPAEKLTYIDILNKKIYVLHEGEWAQLEIPEGKSISYKSDDGNIVRFTNEGVIVIAPKNRSSSICSENSSSTMTSNDQLRYSSAPCVSPRREVQKHESSRCEDQKHESPRCEVQKYETPRQEAPRPRGSNLKKECIEDTEIDVIPSQKYRVCRWQGWERWVTWERWKKR